ncbi:MAG TPA: ATP-binding protein [Methylophilaceae bacterium]|nr:ATP-binding protein [Methylophilaceae bacterium]
MKFPIKFKAFMQQQWELGLMLLSLHAVLVWGFNTPFQKALIICHYGFFLLWQPVWRTKEKISLQALALFLAAGIVMILFLNWWLLAFWLSILFALLGGRIFTTQARSASIGYLLAAGYLIAMLLMWIVPKLFIGSEQYNATAFAIPTFLIEYVLALLPVTIVFTRVAKEERGHPPVLDFFYTLLLLFLAVILVLGSFAIQASSGTNYLEVILTVVFSAAITLITISWLWDPRAGFAGIGQILSRYLLSIGLPFEIWVKNIAELAERKSSAKDFTVSAVQEVSALPWVSGIQWSTTETQGEAGTKTKHFANFDFNDFNLSIYTKWPLTPAITIHLKLLTQILGEFYEAKRREETLSQNIYMQAVYETGSRLTHDIKNLVQSMSALCSAAEQTAEEDSERLVALIRRQLPLLNQRLARTLEKLEAPRIEKNRQLKLTTWWKRIKQHHTQSNIEFVAKDIPSLDIDPDFLDSIVDNLLQNAIEKRKNDRGIHIMAVLNATDEYLIEVRDTGKAMPQGTAEQLFKKQISSENGLGIGLYHAGKQALQSGFQLSLVENKDGAVRFRLSKLEQTLIAAKP